MLTAIIAGERNPKVLAQMARTRMRGKIRQLEEALDCSFFTEQHAFILAMMLAQHRPPHRADQRADREDRRAVRAVRAPDRPAGCHPRLRDHHRPGHHRRDRHGHDRLPHRRAPVLLGPALPAGPRLRRQAQGQQRHRPRQPLPRRRARRGRRQRRPHPDLPRHQIPAPGQADAQEESPGRHQQIPARHLPRPAVRPRSRLHRPRHRLLRAAREHPPRGPQPRPRHRTPRLQGHPRTPRTRTSIPTASCQSPKPANPPAPDEPTALRAAGSCRAPS